MTVVAPVYTVVILGDPDVPLGFVSGNITLDAGQAPHVSGSLTVTVADVETLEMLDPRLTPRIGISVEAEYLPSGTQTRTFDLGLRDVDATASDGSVVLSVASDERLLADWAPLEEDKTAQALETSLRDVVDYVLTEAIGAALDPDPATDADVTRYWDVTNLISNPAPGPAGTDWLVGFNGTFVGSVTMVAPLSPIGPYGVQWTAGSDGSGVSTLISGTWVSTRVVAGHWYTCRFLVACSVSRTAQVGMQWRNSEGERPMFTVYGPTVAVDNTDFNLIYCIAQAPVGATSVWPFVNTTGNSGGEHYFVAGAMAYEGDEVIPYFDGDQADDADYIYEWDDPINPNLSSSRRTAINPRDVESLTWKAGQSALEFLAPLVQSVGLRLVCDEQRVWTLRDETYLADGSLNIRHAVNMIEGTHVISRDSGQWFDAALIEYIWTDLQGIEQTRSDFYALDTPYTLLRRFERRVPYLGAGMAEYYVRRAQQRGREVTATSIANWDAKADQPVTIMFESAAPQEGTTQSVRFDLDNNEITVNSRAVDAPVGSIDELEGSIDSLAGTIDSL